MLHQKYYRAATQMGLNHTELYNFAKRLSYFLSDKKITPTAILNGMFILNKIVEEREKKEVVKPKKQTLEFGNSKHVYLKKFALKIIELKNEGMGAQKIATYLKVNHNAPISRGTIETFLKANKKWLI